MYICDMEVDKKLYEDIKEYCKLNGIKPSEYVNKTLKRAFLEDKYGKSPFNRAEHPIIGNKAFHEAVEAEAKRILNDEEELRKVISAVTVKVDEPDVNKIVYTEDAFGDAADKFNKKFHEGMREAEKTEKEISDYMEKNNLEPVSMEELIFGDDEPRKDVQKPDVNLDKPEAKPRKRTIKPIK